MIEEEGVFHPVCNFVSSIFTGLDLGSDLVREGRSGIVVFCRLSDGVSFALLVTVLMVESSGKMGTLITGIFCSKGVGRVLSHDVIPMIAAIRTEAAKATGPKWLLKESPIVVFASPFA